MVLTYEKLDFFSSISTTVIGLKKALARKWLALKNLKDVVKQCILKRRQSIKSNIEVLSFLVAFIMDHEEAQS